MQWAISALTTKANRALQLEKFCVNLFCHFPCVFNSIFPSFNCQTTKYISFEKLDVSLPVEMSLTLNAAPPGEGLGNIEKRTAW